MGPPGPIQKAFGSPGSRLGLWEPIPTMPAAGVTSASTTVQAAHQGIQIALHSVE